MVKVHNSWRVLRTKHLRQGFLRKYGTIFSRFFSKSSILDVSLGFECTSEHGSLITKATWNWKKIKRGLTDTKMAWRNKNRKKKNGNIQNNKRCIHRKNVAWRNWRLILWNHFYNYSRQFKWHKEIHWL